MLAAADPTGDPALLWQAADSLGIDPRWPAVWKTKDGCGSHRVCCS